MANNINTVTLTGNLTRDPEVRTLPSGTSVCEMGLAVNERFKNSASGEWEERANFFDIVVWGAQGENCGKYLSKGSAVAVSGRLRWRAWEKDGQKRSKVEVVGERVQFLSPPREREEREEYHEPDIPIDSPSESELRPGHGGDEDIPF